MIPFTENSQNRQIHRNIKQISACQELGGGPGAGVGVTASGDSFPFGAVEMFRNETEMMAAQCCECAQCH